MKPTSLFAKLWIDFIADDLASLPAWVQRAADRDAELARQLRSRSELELDLRSQSESWCDPKKQNDVNEVASGISPSRIDEIFAAQASDEGSPSDSAATTDKVAPLVPVERRVHLDDRSRSSNWGMIAIAALVVIPLSVWFSGILETKQGDVVVAEGDSPQPGTTVRQVDFKPLIATVAASQRVAVAVKECSVAFVSRVADVTNSDALALPLAESAALMNQTAGNWKEGPKKLGLAVVRILEARPDDGGRTDNDSTPVRDAP
ncbi:MAG: hypothetical protein AAGG44_13610 [Planctomycetota bacterium]